MHVITTTSGETFQTQAGESILDAALRQNIVLDHSCRNGRCGTCKGRVRQGTTAPIGNETGLSAEELSAGWILTCARAATSNVDLEIECIGNCQLPEAQTLPCRIQALEYLSKDVKRVMLRLPPAVALRYLPGQYINVIGPNGLRRSYSIANAPRTDNQIELHIRHLHNGSMSHYWFEQARINDLLRIHGPFGTFFVRNQSNSNLILLATGTGIAPLKAMLEGMRKLEVRPRSVTIYWGERKEQDLYWNPTIVSPAAQFIPVLSRGETTWAGKRGYVQDALMSTHRELATAAIYASGSNAMIQATCALLKAQGFPANHFYSDAFVCSSDN